MTNDGAVQSIGPFEKIGYGLGDAACNIVFQMVMSFMAYFYTDVFGIAPAAMGTMFLLVRAVNALSDPIFGALSDRTTTRWGKFRPYLLWICIPYAAIAVLTFTTPDWPPQGKLIYAYVTYSLLMLAYTAINVPYCALGAVLTPNARERVSINGYRFFLATAAGALVAFTALPLVKLLGQGNDRLGFSLAMSVLATIAVFMLVACFFMTKERVTPAIPQSINVWSDVKHLLQNDQWWVIAALNFVLFVSLVIQDGATIYYLKWYVGRPDLIPAFLTTGMVSSMIGALCAAPLVAKMPKSTAYATLQALIVSASILLFLLDRTQISALFVVYAVAQFFTQMASPILWAMIAETADYGEARTGRRITGLVFAGALLSLKLGMAVGGALLGWTLSTTGYQSQLATQSTMAIQGIVALFTLVPAFGHFALIFIVRLFRLDRGQHHGN